MPVGAAAGNKLTVVVPDRTSAVNWHVDGTQCTTPTEQTINGAPLGWFFECADNDASSFEAVVLWPAGYTGGTVRLKLAAISTEAAPSGNARVDCTCQCRSGDDTSDGTYGTAVETTFTFDAQYDWEIQTTGAITCNGTCASADVLGLHCEIDATATTTTMTGVHWTAESAVIYPSKGSD